MNTPEDEKWQKLLAFSQSTFAGETVPPYGTATALLARLRAENRQQEELERIGWRALLASLAALMITVGVSMNLSPKDPTADFDPGVKGLVQMENIQVS